MAFTMIVSLYTSRVVLNTLGVTDYGINNVVGGTVTFLTFLVYSMNTATQRFLNVAMGKNDEKEVQHVFSISMTIHFLLLILILIIGEIVGLWLLYNKLIIPPERMTAAFWLFQFTMVSTCTTVMSIPYNAMVIAQERMNVYAYLSILDVVLKLIVVYLLVLSPYDKLITFGFLTMCTFLLNRLLYTIYCKRNFQVCK
jgi:O-antigen/teichoic acid export membrane protein